ncbi:hypothetical protein BDV98DRAFT_343699 [Pterulicium gracile]|uniref:F-box domain-containing protein n=1 Tax=Pterulicium gracile TaxID=1884261 RepID=A0A5C3Q1R9_9AGAR|nr:hypothetical protein BDV98DRAFT_343699 [Pterula gracilis]
MDGLFSPSRTLPTAEELGDIRSRKIASDTAIGSLKRRMEELTSEIATTQSRLSFERQQADVCEALLSPIRKGPIDILRSIFTFVPPNSPTISRSVFGGISKSDASWPWSGLQVCRQWKEAIRWYRPLWSTINIDSNSPCQRCLERPTHLVWEREEFLSTLGGSIHNRNPRFTPLDVGPHISTHQYSSRTGPTDHLRLPPRVIVSSTDTVTPHELDPRSLR